MEVQPNYRRHLQTKHPPALLQQRQDDQPAGDAAPAPAAPTSGPDIGLQNAPARCETRRPQQQSIGVYARRAMGPNRQKKLDEELLKMIVLDFQQFSVVEDKGSRGFAKALDPSYTLPNRMALSGTHMPQPFHKIRSVVVDKICNVSAVCLTTDCWTSRNTTSVMAVTCHYIDEGFKLNSTLLDCFYMSERHTADNLASELQNGT